MSEEWKELDIGNLPPDILVGDYEFEWKKNDSNQWVSTASTGKMVIENLLRDCTGIYCFRPRQPKPPSHPEILTKWWKWGNKWFKVLEYCNNSEEPYLILGFECNVRVSADWFIGRESAEIPPEASND